MPLAISSLNYSVFSLPFPAHRGPPSPAVAPMDSPSLRIPSHPLPRPGELASPVPSTPRVTALAFQGFQSQLEGEAPPQGRQQAVLPVPLWTPAVRASGQLPWQGAEPQRGGLTPEVRTGAAEAVGHGHLPTAGEARRLASGQDRRGSGLLGLLLRTCHAPALQSDIRHPTILCRTSSSAKGDVKRTCPAGLLSGWCPRVPGTPRPAFLVGAVFGRILQGEVGARCHANQESVLTELNLPLTGGIWVLVALINPPTDPAREFLSSPFCSGQRRPWELR